MDGAFPGLPRATGRCLPLRSVSEDDVSGYSFPLWARGTTRRATRVPMHAPPDPSCGTPAPFPRFFARDTRRAHPEPSPRAPRDASTFFSPSTHVPPPAGSPAPSAIPTPTLHRSPPRPFIDTHLDPSSHDPLRAFHRAVTTTLGLLETENTAVMPAHAPLPPEGMRGQAQVVVRAAPRRTLDSKIEASTTKQRRTGVRRPRRPSRGAPRDLPVALRRARARRSTARPGFFPRRTSFERVARRRVPKRTRAPTASNHARARRRKRSRDS